MHLKASLPFELHMYIIPSLSSLKILIPFIFPTSPEPSGHVVVFEVS